MGGVIFCSLFSWITLLIIVATEGASFLAQCLDKNKSPRVPYYHWIRGQYDKKNSVRPMRKEDIPICVQMAMESFEGKYPKEQFDTIEEEFMAAFSEDWWGRPRYFVCEYQGKILGMGGYALSWLDWDTFEFFWSCVRKGYEGNGIGKMLVEHREKEVLKDSAFKNDITIMFSCTREVVNYHKRHGYKVLLKKAGGKEVIMGKTFLKK